HCMRTRQYLSMGEFGTDIKEMDKSKTDKAKHNNVMSAQSQGVLAKLEKGNKLLDDKLNLEELMGF
ncbi:hypothetical protein Tco_0708691, partial [Tanacetum coccineum]